MFRGLDFHIEYDERKIQEHSIWKLQMFGLRGKKRDSTIEVNLLELVPSRTVDFELRESNLVTILAPRFKNGIFKKLFQPRLKKPFLKVDLDEIGSEVWLLCDGKRNIREIGERLKEKFAERIEPCYERLSIFFKQLENARFIEFVNLKECLKASSTESGADNEME